MRLALICAMAENRTIGKDNSLPWHLSEDLKYFRKVTTGHCIIMGRKTFQSFPKPLPNRVHLVITRNKDYHPEGAIIVHSMAEALEVAKNDNQAFIIGGGEIYKIGMEIADKIELTRVNGSFEADTFFPEISSENWKLASEEFHLKDEKHKFDFSYQTFVSN